MAAIRGKNTFPERTLRSLLHRAGLRFRLHPRWLSGRPDIYLARWNCAVFVNGCFWHRHKGCCFTTMPSRNKAFWQEKFDRNVERDREILRELRRSGVRVIVVWECSLRRNAARTAQQVIAKIMGRQDRHI